MNLVNINFSYVFEVYEGNGRWRRISDIKELKNGQVFRGRCIETNELYTKEPCSDYTFSTSCFQAMQDGTTINKTVFQDNIVLEINAIPVKEDGIEHLLWKMMDTSFVSNMLIKHIYFGVGT